MKRNVISDVPKTKINKIPPLLIILEFQAKIPSPGAGS
jgi:hypothetical protein